MMQIRLLGDFKVADLDKPIPGLTRPRMQSLLAYLLLHCDAPQSRSHLAYTFWPDSSDSQARTNLRRELLQLRRALPHSEQYLRIETQTIQWNPEADYSLDVAGFTTTLAEAKTSPESVRRAELLQTAVDIYRGDLLLGLYEEWILVEREKLAQQYVHALEQLLTLHTDQRNFTLAIEATQRLLRYDPLYEAGYSRLMELYAYQNERARALHTYHTYATLLERELGVAPGADIQRLYEQLVQAETAGELLPSSKTPESKQLVGRTREWQTLLSTWRRASRGRAQFVLIEGEAGIGKTRLGEELMEWVNRQGFLTARTRSYAAEGSLAYAPIIEWLRSDIVQPRLVNLDLAWQSEIARLLPELLGANPQIPHPQPLTEHWRRQRLFEALAHAFTAVGRPMLLLIDDLQWCDQETMEWLRYLLRFDTTAPLLVVGTARPEEIRAEHPLRPLVNELGSSGQLTTIPLAHLNRDETRTLAEQVCGKKLTDQEVSQLYSASEGYPLFVVEMVRAGYHERKRGDEAEAAMSTPDAQLPPKVVTLIQSRLAQLSPTTRKLANLAAAVGRSFDFDVLIASSDDDEDTVANGLDELWRRRIIREQGINAYDFSHDRIRDVAYTEIGPVKRRYYHHHIAAALQQLYEGKTEEVAGQLALHFQEAGLLSKAISYLQIAGNAAANVYANAEAMVHYSRAADLGETGAVSSEDLVQIYTRLGGLLLVTKGDGAPEVEQAYGRAFRLIQELDESLQHFAALRGLAMFHRQRGELIQARTLAEQLVKLAKKLQDEALVTEASFALGSLLLYLGEYSTALIYLEQALNSYRLEQNNSPDLLYDQDPGIATMSYTCFSLWLLGYPDQALQRCSETVDLAQELSHPYSLAMALIWTNWIYRFCSDQSKFLENSRLAISLSQEHDFQLFKAVGLLQNGWALFEAGDIEEGIAQMEKSLTMVALARGTELAYPAQLVLLAEAYGKAGRMDEGLQLIDNTIEVVGESMERFLEPEYYRLKGDVMLIHGDPVDDVEAKYKQAIDISRKQEAKSLELRAVMSLALLWQSQGKKEDAHRMLAKIYNWFSEGFDTHDLQAAKELLDQLS